MRKKKVEKAEKKVSPYVAFREWLINPMPDAKLSEETIKAVNPRTALMMFGTLGGITLYLNEYFNNFDVFYLDRLEFYTFLRQLVQRYRVGKYDFSYFKTEKSDKSLTDIQKRYTYLKRYELGLLLETLKGDDLEYFQEEVGLKEAKRTKVPKSEVKKTEKKKKEKEKKS